MAGLVALMAVGLAGVLIVAGGGDGGEEAAPRAVASPGPTAQATPTPAATPRPLTRRERAERAAAAGIVRSRGFSVVRLRDYDPRSVLRVLLGRDPSGARLAFFFARDEYVGNDAEEPSAELRVRRRRPRRVTLAYGVYAPGDESCCPSGGPVPVRFELEGAAVAPVDPMPPAEQRSPAHQQS